MTTATPRPSRAPALDAARLVDAWNAESRNTAVSSPSRSTARNAIATIANTEPSATAAPARASSSS